MDFITIYILSAALNGRVLNPRPLLANNCLVVMGTFILHSSCTCKIATSYVNITVGVRGSKIRGIESVSVRKGSPRHLFCNKLNWRESAWAFVRSPCFVKKRNCGRGLAASHTPATIWSRATLGTWFRHLNRWIKLSKLTNKKKKTRCFNAYATVRRKPLGLLETPGRLHWLQNYVKKGLGGCVLSSTCIHTCILLTNDLSGSVFV